MRLIDVDSYLTAVMVNLLEAYYAPGTLKREVSDRFLDNISVHDYTDVHENLTELTQWLEPRLPYNGCVFSYKEFNIPSAMSSTLSENPEIDKLEELDPKAFNQLSDKRVERQQYEEMLCGT